MSRQLTPNEQKKLVGERIRQARLMAGFETLSKLTEKFPDWSERRLGNYETGVSLPNPVDILRIAKETQTSPCWITFGIGSIRSSDRDIQAIRYQNLAHLYERMSKTEQMALRKTLKLKPSDIKRHLENPYLKITDTLCRKIERHLKKQKNWMDQQHIEIDGMGDYFPEDVKEVLTIYSNLDKKGRQLFLEMAHSIKNYTQS